MFVVCMWKRYDVLNNIVCCVDIKNDVMICKIGLIYYVVEVIILRDFGWFILILLRD